MLHNIPVAVKKLIIGIIIGIASVICILAIGITPKTLQNDTFYTITLGEYVLNNGIDMLEHFSWHEGLIYTYPHWLYDVFIYTIYIIKHYYHLSQDKYIADYVGHKKI